MFRSATGFKGMTIAALDGNIGSVKDLYFDDRTWTVRYLVVDTGTWLPGRQVLISPLSVQGTSSKDEVAVSLNQEQVKGSPSIDTDRPVNRQHETELLSYYGYPYYWAGPYRWGLADYAGALTIPPLPPSDPVAEEMAARARQEQGDPSLRSVLDVTGYSIAASDGAIGHVEDFLIDEPAWAIRYMVVDTRNWLPGKKVIVSPEWIESVSWPESTVHVSLRRDHIEAAPEYDPTRSLERAEESRLFEHHGRQKYWEREAR